MCVCACPQISELEQDKRDLERQVNELKAKCEQIEKRAAEQRQVEEKKHAEEIQFLKRTNQQLKVSQSIAPPPAAVMIGAIGSLLAWAMIVA